MKVVIDISPLHVAHKHRGVGSYTRSLVEALQKYDPENDYILTSKSHQVEADLIHYPYFDLFFLTLPYSKSKPTVVTIHDTIPLIYPKAYPPGLRGALKLRLQKLSLRSVKAIITDSDRSAKDIQKYLKQPAEKINRVYLAADTHFHKIAHDQALTVLSKYNIQQPYLLYVGDINYNKNIPRLLKVFGQVKTNHQLVLVSRALNQPIPQAAEIHRLIEELKLTQRVKIVTAIPIDPKTEMAALYSETDWYIQPSLYEGFGLPVLESIACKSGTIVSTGGSLPEITPPGSITFNPGEDRSMQKAMEQAMALSQTEKQALLLKSQQFARQFTWERTAQATIKVYRHALNSL